MRKAVRAEVAAGYHVTKTGGRADVQFPCDGLGPNIREITLQTGSGHGHGLQLWHARRAGTRFDVHGLVFRDGNPTPVTLAAGTVELPDLANLRAGVSATIREVAPKPKPGARLRFSGTGSSRDFHILVRLVDDDGRVVEKQYTGYAGSSNQDEYLGLEVALAALAPITALEAKSGTPTVEDKEFFARQFNAAVPRFDTELYWWVMERLVAMAKHLGSAEVIDGLLTRLDVTTQERSKIDARADAVAALAAITGWDATEGGKKTVEQAAASYRATCRATGP